MPAQSHPVVVAADGEVRGTQSFVQVMAAVWRRPSLTGLEILWRWVFGIFTLCLMLGVVQRLLRVPEATTAVAGVQNASWNDPMAASVKVGEAASLLLPTVLAAVLWLLPMLFAGWVFLASLGRAQVMRRLSPQLKPMAPTFMALNAIRLAFLGGTFALWFWVLTQIGAYTVSGPAARSAEPNLVLYFALVIGLTLLLFVVWAAASWVLSIAPMLAMLRGLNVRQSLLLAMRLGPLRSKLVEINLVMGIVKVALVVVAMVLSACPLPFQTYATQGFLWTWWACVTVLYLVASDYFHVVRIAAYLVLWRAYEDPEKIPLPRPERTASYG